MQTFVAPVRWSPASLSSPLHPPKLLAVGDSLIYGHGDPEGGGWVERLRRRWMHPEKPGPVLYNLGVRGDGVQQVARRLEGEFRGRGELRNQVPDGLILAVGVNDSARLGHGQGRNYTAFDTFEEEIQTLLGVATQLCPVWFVGMIPVDEQKMPFLDAFFYNHGDQRRYNDAIRQACGARQVPFLNLLEIWLAREGDWWRSRLSSDGLHPNGIGYQAILQDVLHWDALAQFV